MKYDHASLCQYGPYSCLGCCGHHFTSVEDLDEGIRKNTAEFSEVESGEVSHEAFRDRRGGNVRSCGACPNLIFDKHRTPTERQLLKGKDHRRVICSIHPKQVTDTASRYGKDDLREGYCDILHVCKTAYLFERWSDEWKDSFVKFLKQKDLDWYTYSEGISSGTFLDEFENI